MINTNHKVLLGMMALLNVFSPILEAAAPAPAKESAPLTIEADHLHLNDTTGDVFARGSAIVTQENDKLLSDLIRGNTKEHMLWIDDEATFLHDTLTLIGNKLVYNYQQKTGSMEKTKTSVARDDAPEGYFQHEKTPLIVQGGYTEFSSEKAIIHHASATSCTLHSPDYRFTADKIEVWPGDKLIAYNLKLYLKNTPLITLPKHRISLKAEDQKTQSILPRVGYDSDDGITLAQYLEYPVTGKTSLFADLVYYSKKDFKPSYGVKYKEDNYSLTLQEVNKKNGDDEWIEKKSDVLFAFNPMRLGSSSLSANLSAEIGDWQEDEVQGWRKAYSLYLSNDPIKLGSKTTLSLGTGFEKIHYGYNDTNNNIFRFDTRINAKPNDKLDMWTGYSYVQQTGTSPYQYDRIDNPRELNVGFMYRVDKKDGLGVNVVHNLDNGSLKDVDYTWKRDLHCWEAEITYRAKRDQWRFDIMNVAW